MAIATVVELAGIALLEDTDCALDEAAGGPPPSGVIHNEAVTSAVRKRLTPALRDLIQHGLMPVEDIFYLV